MKQIINNQLNNKFYTRVKVLLLSSVVLLAYGIFSYGIGGLNEAQATVPKYINFQGKLTKVSDGTNMVNGNYAFEFKLYDALTSGSLLWTETFDQPSGACGKLAVTNGVFNAKLGSCNSLSGIDFTGGSVYLSVNFAPTGTSYDGEMSPRKQLVSSAFALVANGVSGDGVINTAVQSSTALTVGRTGSNPALTVDTNTASSATGLKVTAAAAGGGLAITTISSGTDENLTVDAKGAGTISIGGTSTGNILLAGGSGSTGCTITNSNGNLTCTGSITGASTGTFGYWDRTGTVLSPATAGDDLELDSGDYLGLSSSIVRLVFNDAARDNITVTAGDLLFSVDNTWDIGASGATRARTIYAGTSVIAPTINATTALQVGGADINTAGTLTNVAYLNQANTFTAGQTITPAVNTTGLAVSSYSLTGSDTHSLIDLSGTWNTSGTPTAIKLNITDTASGATSFFVDLQKAGSTVFSVNKNGSVSLNGTLSVGSTSIFAYGLRSRITSPADGQLLLQNAAQTDFGRLEFGGTTSSFPSIKRSGAGLQARLADDSGYTTFDASDYLLSGTSINTAGTLTNVAYKNQANTFTANNIFQPTVTTGTGSSAGVQISAGSLTSGNGLDISSSTLTSGNLVSISSNGTAAAASQTGLNISLQGTTATNAITSYGAQISNTHANATSGTNVALQLTASGATTANYALVTNGGSVGIGTTTPTSMLDVVTSSGSATESLFTVRSGSSTASNFSVRPYGANFGSDIAFNRTFNGTDDIRSNNAYSSFRIAHSPTGSPESLAFQSAPSGSGAISYTTALAISDTGRVGIGMVPAATYDKLQIQGSDGTGNGVALSIRNTDTSSLSFAMYKLNVGAGSDGGMFFGSSAALDAYGIANGMTLRAGTTSQDLGFSVGNNISGTGSGPNLIVKASGNVGIGDITPAALFTVGSGDLFQVNSSGAIAAATGITSSGTINFSGLTASSAVYTDGSKNLTSTAPTSGAIGYWSRTGTTLSPTTSGDNITTTGNISTTSSGTITSAGLLTGSLGATISGATISLNDSSNFGVSIAGGTSTGTITLGGTGASQSIQIGTGVAAKTIAIGNSTDDTFSINSSAFTVSTSGAVSGVTTLTSSGSTTIGTGSSSANTMGAGASSTNVIGSSTTPGALTLHGATTLDNTFTVSGSNLTTLGGNLTVTGTTWTATPTISGLITATSGLTSNGTLTVSANQNLTMASGTGVFAQTSTSTTTDTRTLSATALTTGKAETITLGSALTTGGALSVTGASYAHGTETGSLVNLAFTDATTAAVTSTTNGVLISPTISAASGAATRTINGVSVEPAFTNCAAGTCTVNGVNVANVTDGTGFTSAAINFGTGWDTVIKGTTAGGNIIDFTNFKITSAGVASALTGLSSSGNINFSALSASSAVYTDGSKNLTSTAPTSGAIGYWSRSGTTLSQTTANDVLSLSGNTGDILTIASSATGSANKALNISQTGATTGTDYAGYFSNTGAATTNVGLYATASGATNNYAAIFDAGNVGIGDTSPAALLTVGSGDLFQVNSSGAIAAVTGITTSGGYTQSGSGANSFSGASTFNDILRAAGAVTESALSTDRIDIGVQAGTPRMVFEDNGSTIWEVDNNAGVFRWFTPGVERLTLNSSGDLDLKTGALLMNTTSVLTSGRVLQNLTGITSSGTITLSGLGGSGTQCLQTNNTGVISGTGSTCGGPLTVGTTTLTSGAANRVLFENGSNVLSESANFTYDGTTLGVSNASTTASNKVINISQTGATTGTDYAGYFSNTGAATTNVGLYATASGATNNYAAIFDAGNVGIGTTSPTASGLDVTNSSGVIPTDGVMRVVATGNSGSGAIFQVKGTGNNNQFMNIDFNGTSIFNIGVQGTEITAPGRLVLTGGSAVGVNDPDNANIHRMEGTLSSGNAYDTYGLRVKPTGVTNNNNVDQGAIRAVIGSSATSTDPSASSHGLFADATALFTTGDGLGTVGNFGVYALNTGTVAGDRYGVSGVVTGGDRNIGLVGRSVGTKNSATNIGVLGYAINAGTSPVQIGGYFGLQSTLPTFASAALMADNGSTTSNIFVARDNGTATFTIADGGSITSTSLTSGGSQCLQANSSGVISGTGSACGSGGGTTVGGSIASGTANRVLYENSSNQLAESANLTYDGTTLGVSNASTTASNKVINVSQTGATSGTDYAGYFSNTGAATTNVGLYATATGATNNYAAIFDAGRVGIGTTSPEAPLHVSGTNNFGAISFLGGTYDIGLQVDPTYSTDTAHSGSYASQSILRMTNSSQASAATFGGQASAIYNTGSATLPANTNLFGSIGSVLMAGTGSVPAAAGVAGFVIRQNTNTIDSASGGVFGFQNYVGSGTTGTVTGVTIAQPISTAGHTITNTFGIYIADQTNTAGTQTNTPYAIYQAGSSNYNYFAGNVGVGDASPNSLFTVGSGDLFQINSSGQIGSQQAPVSDYLFALAGTTGNDNSRIIDITQANNATEDSNVINIVNTANPGTISTAITRSIQNITSSLTPTATVNGASASLVLNVYGSDSSVSLGSVTVADVTGANSADIAASSMRGTLTFDPIINDTGSTGISTLLGYGTYSSVTGAPTLTSVTGPTSAGTYGGYFTNTASSAGNANLTYSAIGIQASALGDLTTTGGTEHVGALILSTGTADTNYGIYADVSGATNNYAAILTGGNVGIGDTSPAALFTVGSGDLFQVNSSGAIAAATGITSSGTITFSGLGGGGTKCVQTDNAGVITAAASACGSGSGITIGTTAITSGSSGRILYDNAGVVGEMTTSGSGTVVALATTPTFTTNITTPIVNGSTSADGTLTIQGNNTTGNTSTSANLVFKVGDSAGTTAMTILNNGNVGVGDSSPASLFTVGSGDLFQINSSGQIGSQQAPVSDYLFALAGTTGNDNSRIIDITQANDSNENSQVINIANTVNTGTVSNTTRTISNITQTLTPTTTLTVSSSNSELDIYGQENTVSLANTTLGAVSSFNTSFIRANADSQALTFSPTINDTSGSGIPIIYGSANKAVVTGAPTLTSLAGSVTMSARAGDFQTAVTSAGNANLTYDSYGVYSSVNGDLTTTGTTAHYGGYFNTSGTADTNYGIYAAVTGATTNYAGIFTGGNVGIGTATPTSLLHVQQSADSTSTTAPIALDINSVGSAGELTATSGLQTFARFAPTVNQSSTAGYNALLINSTETALGSGMNRLVDLQVGGSTKFAVRNDGSLTLQDTAYITTPYGGFGKFQNLLVRSEEFDNASWIKTSVSAPTADAQVAPDGSSTAESLATSGSGGDVCQWSATAAGSNTFTFSVWVKAASGTQNFGLRVDAGATSCATANNVTGTEQTYTATTSWQRYEVTKTFSSATGNVKVRIFPGTTGSTGTVYAWGAQLDQASKATNYAYTAGSTLSNINYGRTTESNVAATASSTFTYGARNIMKVATGSDIDATYVADFIRVYDNDCSPDCDNTTKGLEVQAYSGTNLAGTNIGIDAYGYTFGVKATTTGQASNVAQPAAVFADLDNGSATTTGNAIRAYTDNATSADLVSLYQETSTYTGNGLELNFGNGGGSFTGNFISLQKGGTESFHVDDDGSTFVSFTGTGTGNAVCHATNGNANNDELVDCSSTPSADFAEMYPVDTGIEVGDIVVTGTQMVNTYDATSRGSVNWNVVKGQIAKLKKSTKGYQENVVGVVSDNYHDFTSTGYNIKPQDNPKSIALKGRVLVKVTNENGPIKAGDYITASSAIPGFGAKASRSGQVVGRALADFEFDSGNTGLVMVFMQVGYQSIGNTIVLDAPTINSTNLQSGEEDLTSNNASTFVIQQQAAEEDEEQAVANILQLQTGDQNRFMVSSTGATSILSNLNCELDADSCPSVLNVTQANTELMNIDARGTLTLAGTIVIKDDSFAGSVVTKQDGTAEVMFSYHLGTGKPVVQLTVEAQIPVFAQILEFKQDDNGNYIGFVMKTFDMIASPIQAIVHYNVIGKQDGYITLGEVSVPSMYSPGDGYGIIIQDGQAITPDGDGPDDPITPDDLLVVDQDNSQNNGTVSGASDPPSNE